MLIWQFFIFTFFPDFIDISLSSKCYRLETESKIKALESEQFSFMFAFFGPYFTILCWYILKLIKQNVNLDRTVKSFSNTLEFERHLKSVTKPV